MKSEIRYNEPPEIYHATRAISKSGMDKLRQAPAKFKAWRDGAAEEETEALLFGSVFHCLALEPGEFGHTLGDAHLYLNHMEQADEQLSREPRPLPVMRLNPDVKSLFDFRYGDFTLEGYDPWPAIKAPMSF